MKKKADTKQPKRKLSEITKKKMEEIFIKQQNDPKEDPARTYLQLLNHYEPPAFFKRRG